MQEEKFSLFIPIELEKSDKVGEERYKNMRFKGIASNPNEGLDKQGQWLDPSGFNLNQFVKEGTLNWHHRWKDKPTAIIGQPTHASINKSNELYVEGMLYASSQMARDVYDLAEIMEKDSPDRRMGFSIEGVPLVVDPKDKNRILKAKITNLAITPSPICPGTKMELMKGGLDDLEFENNETEYLIDITENGIRYTVDRQLVIQKSETGSASLSTEAHTQVGETAEQKDRVTAKESLDRGDRKKKKDDDEEKKVANIEKKSDYLTKSELCLNILSIFNQIDNNSVKRILNLSEEIEKSINPNMEVTKISDEAYQKALQSLGLVKGENSEALALAETEKKAKEVEELKKAEDEVKAKLESELKDTLQKAEEIKAKIEGKEIVKAVEMPILSEVKVENIAKEEIAELQKGFDEKFSSLATILQKKGEENAELKKALEDQSLFLTKLGQKIGLIEKQPLERKSLSGVNYIERFEKGEKDSIEKSEGETFSLSNLTQRKELTDRMWDAFEKAEMKDNELEKGMRSIEMAGILGTPQEAVKLAARLKKDFKINVVK